VEGKWAVGGDFVLSKIGEKKVIDDNDFTVTPIMPKAAGTLDTMTGFITDHYCIKSQMGGGTTPDGSDVLFAPQGHSVHCLVDLTKCVNSGYCLTQGAVNSFTQTEYRCVHNFTTAARDHIIAYYVEKFPRVSNNVPLARKTAEITVEGKWAVGGDFVLSKIGDEEVTESGSSGAGALATLAAGISFLGALVM